MTHPDDEISICAWIRRLRRAGCQVFMSWTHSLPIREREARAVALLLDIPQENLFFHGARDGEVCMQIQDLYPSFKRMFEIVQPDRVCCGAFEQGHLDHDATNFLVHHTASSPVLEIPFYHIYRSRIQTLNRFSNPHGQEVLNLSLEEQRFKRLIAKQYPSQNIWKVLFWYELSQNARFRRMQLVKTERMRVKQNWNYLIPNHGSRLSRRVLKSKNWKRWLEAMRKNADYVSDSDSTGDAPCLHKQGSSY